MKDNNTAMQLSHILKQPEQDGAWERAPGPARTCLGGQIGLKSLALIGCLTLAVPFNF